MSKLPLKLINSYSVELKFAIVTPVFNLDYSNHKPISLIANVDKLIEKIVLKWVYSFLEKNYLFEWYQGFRNKLSTNHDNGQRVCENYVDFKKAFETVNHNLTLGKLAHYRVSSTGNNWKQLLQTKNLSN